MPRLPNTFALQVAYAAKRLAEKGPWPPLSSVGRSVPGGNCGRRLRAGLIAPADAEILEVELVVGRCSPAESVSLFRSEERRADSTDDENAAVAGRASSGTMRWIVRSHLWARSR